MRIMANAIVVSAFVLICAGISASNLADSQTPLAALQMKVEQARPRDKCYLYAELVSRMTDLAGQQLHSSDSAQAWGDPHAGATICREDPFEPCR
jgi:hypothetical protein